MQNVEKIDFLKGFVEKNRVLSTENVLYYNYDKYMRENADL